MSVRTEADGKDNEIRELLTWPTNELGQSFVVTDHLGS